jgi:hypothetical protein
MNSKQRRKAKRKLLREFIKKGGFETQTTLTWVQTVTNVEINWILNHLDKLALAA